MSTLYLQPPLLQVASVTRTDRTWTAPWTMTKDMLRPDVWYEMGKDSRVIGLEDAMWQNEPQDETTPGRATLKRCWSQAVSGVAVTVRPAASTGAHPGSALPGLPPWHLHRMWHRLHPPSLTGCTRSGRATDNGRSPTRQDNQVWSALWEGTSIAFAEILRRLCTHVELCHLEEISLEEHRCSPDRTLAEQAWFAVCSASHRAADAFLFVQSDNWRRCPRCLGETLDRPVTAVCGAI